MSKPHAPVDTPASSVRGEEAERVDINLGHACNHKCVFCMQGDSGIDQKKWVTLEKLTRELDYYANEKGVHSLGLLGGEPTLYPWLYEGLDLARGFGFDDITINTNGFKLAEWDFARTVAEKGINRYCISLHSEDPAIEDYLSGHKGALIRKMTAIRNLIRLRKEGIRETVISINAVLNAMNLPTMDRFIAFFSHVGIRDIRLNFIRPEGRAANSEDLIPTYKAAIPQLMELVALNEAKFNIRLTFGEIPACVFPKSFFNNTTLRHRYVGEYTDRRTFVTTFGNKEGHLTDGTGRQRFVWQDLKMDELKSYVAACETCVWRGVCGGVWTNYLEMYGDEEFEPITD
jgi:MoaA/NifB/PqqE/SkfB family radical SAM enzyme